MDISIIIPAKNEARNIKNCLNGVFRQKHKLEFEIIIIDSGSEDSTIEIIESFDDLRIKIIKIKSEDFGHGKTRNLGYKCSKGKFIVFLNADAIPCDEHWLFNLYQNFKKHSQVAAVFSKQLPKNDCFYYMQRDIHETFGDEKQIKSKTSKFNQMIFSTVSCMIKKEIFKRTQFTEDIIIAEDQDWAKRMLNKFNLTIIYEPVSCVSHSHNYSNKILYQIKKEVGYAINPFKYKITALTLGLVFSVGIFFLKISKDFKYIFFSKKSNFKRKIIEFKIAVSARYFSYLGKYVGWICTKV